jgi:raffinose synthase
MKSLLFIAVISMVLIVHDASALQQKNGNNIISIKIENEKLSIYSDGALKASGGSVAVSSNIITATHVTEHRSEYSFHSFSTPIKLLIKKGKNSTVSFFISPNGNQSNKGDDFLGLFFDQIPGFHKGVTIWRYKPWNSWTKPIRISTTGEMERWDVQFFYWKYSDGSYGAAIPLSGQGYRTTLGQTDGKFGAKAVCYKDTVEKHTIPLMTLGFGNDPYALFEQLYEDGLRHMGCPENSIKNKRFPSILENIGWCTWNSSDQGRNLNENFLLQAAKSFSNAKFPLKYIIVDDGWFDATESQLNSYYPNKEKFPNGFTQVIEKLKKEYGISDVGLWQAYDGYWQGINPNSELGKKYKNDLFSWTEKIRPDLDSSEMKTCWFIRPDSPSLQKFYDEFHTVIKQQGFSFLKVDNQLITERMCVQNFPIWDGAQKYHQALYTSLAKQFDNTVINCMDMTADAYFNFGSTSVARTVEDYFPFEKDETYNLQKGNAAAHVLQAVYNALYFSQMVYPDFDMFESSNPNAEFHAIARAINNGPIYITDKIGEQNYDVLRSLVLNDGKLLRPDRPLLPVEDCLFQIQDAKPFKAYSMDGNIGLLGIWNCADTDSVTGTFTPADVHPITGNTFAIYERLSKELKLASKTDTFTISIGRLGTKLYYILPLVEGNAIIGLVNKYNAPKAVLQSTVKSNRLKAVLYEGGDFAAVVRTKPKRVRVDGKECDFVFNNHLLTMDIPLTQHHKQRYIEIDL